MAINFLYPTNTRPEIQINDTDDNPRLAFQESGTVSGGISTTGGNLVFEASSGIERARIDSVGRLMVNTTSPFVNAAITVVGLSGTNVSAVVKSTDNQAWLSVQDDASGTYGALFGTDSDAGLAIILADSSATNRLVIDTSGKVGIGTNDPDRKLHVHSTSGDGMIRVSGDNILNSGGEIKGFNNGFAFNVAPSGGGTYVERMRINGSGNVGIGTTSPYLKLHVAGDTRVQGNLMVGDAFYQNTPDAVIHIKSSGTNAKLRIEDSDNANQYWDFLVDQGNALYFNEDTDTRVTFKEGGNVGIGTTSPGGKLDIAYTGTGGTGTQGIGEGLNISSFTPNITFNDNSTGVDNYAIHLNQNVFTLGRYTSSTSQSPDLVLVSGNVGIGTTSPTAGLHVVGTGLFTGLVSGITPVNAANFVTKAYVDGSGGGTGPFLPLAGGTMTGTIVGPTAGSSSANPPALEVVASGTANEQASIAIQQKTSEGDTIIFADYEPHVEWGISTENGANEIQFTAGSSTNSLSSKTLYNNAGNARTAYVKFNHKLTNGNTEIGGTLDVGQALTVSSTATANSFTSSTDTGISINGITMTRVAANSAIRVSNGLETLGLLRSYAGLIVGTSATIGSSTQGNTLTISSAQGSRNTTFLSAGNGGYVRYESANDGIYGYIGSGSHLLSPVVNDNDFVARAQGEFAVSIGATEKLRINSSGNTILSGSLLPNVNGGGSLGIGTKQWTALHLTSGSAVTWANGDASIVEGEVGSYSLSFRTYDGTSNSRALLLEGNNDATFAGKAYGVTPIASDLDAMLATKKYVDDSITGGANYLGTWDPDDSLNNGYGNPSLQASGRTDDSGDYFICSADGAAHPNGGTSEPDSWHVGDWVIWNEDLGTVGLWQKLDNTTVLSGGGTTNSIAKFTDNETIGDSLLKDTGKLTYTTSQSALMDLKGTTASGYAELDIKNDSDNSIVIGSIGSTYGAADWTNSTYIYNDGTGRNMYLKSVTDMMFFAGGLALAQIRMTVKASGNVGIGTGTPAAGLQVALGGSTIPTAGTSTASAVFGNSASDDNYGLAVGANSSGVGYISSQRTDGTATTYNLAIQPNGGNVSIGSGAVGNLGGDKLHVDGTLRVGPYFSVSDRDFIKLIPHGTDTKIYSPNERFHIENPSGDIIVTPSSAGGVGIGTETPEAKLDVTNGAGKFCVDSKTHAVTNAFTTCLTVNLNSHTGCYVTLTCFGDWGSHSSAAYRGEFFLQNGANSYNEPGIILRQDDNTSVGTDQIVCQLLDPTGTGNPKDFAIQIRTTATSGTTGFTGQLTYTVQGKFNSIT